MVCPRKISIQEIDKVKTPGFKRYKNCERGEWERYFAEDGEDGLSIKMRANGGSKKGLILVSGTYGVSCTCDFNTVKTAVSVVINGMRRMKTAYSKFEE